MGTFDRRSPDKGSGKIKGSSFVIAVLVFYAVAAAAAFVIFAGTGRFHEKEASANEQEIRQMDEGLKAPEPEEDGSVMSQEEYEAFMSAYGNGTDTYETEEKPSKSFDVQEHRQILDESREAIKSAEETMKSLSANNTLSGDAVIAGDATVSGNTGEKPDSVSADDIGKDEKKEEAKTEADPDRKYYSFTVNGIGALSLHRTFTQKGDDMGSMRQGETGYVISLNPASPGNDRVLVVCKGMVGYASATYLMITEIEPGDFPAEYLELSEADAGTVLETEKND